MKLPKESISTEDAEKIRSLATQIVFKVADCGPLQVSFENDQKTYHSKLSGFQATKARNIIEEMIFDFLLKGY